MAFKDHFSSQSAAYRRYRPEYPAALIRYVASLAPDRRVAIDCATGNGQAAVALAEHFETVLAVDGSWSQLERAQAHARVHYAAGLSEQLPLRDRSVSLVAAAQAAHWFDFDRFHAECRRVLVPGGVVALWTYEKFRVDPRVVAVIDQFYSAVVGPYWPSERRFVDEAYRTLPFPWREESAPPFALETDWELQQVMGYLATWSAVQRYKDQRGEDPLPALTPRLAAEWPDGKARRLRWPIHLRIGRA
ncbi:MAG: Class SAM-dependent methyltransferase [Pseudomonadota bacterium]|nr:Class SAM-dependent methyltransferase [Pseudomonadota bacterium]